MYSLRVTWLMASRHLPPIRTNSLLAMVAEATGVPDSVFRRVGLATRLPVMMMRLMFIVICDVVSSGLVLTGRRPAPAGLGQALSSSDSLQEPFGPRVGEKIGVHCNFSFQTVNCSS